MKFVGDTSLPIFGEWGYPSRSFSIGVVWCDEVGQRPGHLAQPSLVLWRGGGLAVCRWSSRCLVSGMDFSKLVGGLGRTALYDVDARMYVVDKEEGRKVSM